MIKLNDVSFDFKHFPDKTIHFNLADPGYADITWLYSDDSEMVNLYYLVSHLRSLGLDRIELFMPYIPNARMDRIHHSDECFTLKYFANFINSLKFDKVMVYDPHSPVSEALIENIQVIRPVADIEFLLKKLPKNLTLFFPDDGAYKKYYDAFRMPTAFGVKNRDWETGKITSYNIAGEAKHMIAGHPILIIDDICSRGGTFYYAAHALKEAGASNIFLCVSHCENSVLEPNFNGQSLMDIPNLITEMYTTNSIYTGQHDKIGFFRKF